MIHQPNGVKMYHSLLEYHTTIQGINPEDIYAMGQEEIRFELQWFIFFIKIFFLIFTKLLIGSTHLRMLKESLTLVAELQGYGRITNNLRQFFDQIQNETKLQFLNESETIQYLNETVQKIKRKFGLAFDSEILNLRGILEIDVVKGPNNQSVLAEYKAPSLDGKRKGIFNLP